MSNKFNSKEEFLSSMEDLKSAINTLMQIDSKLFSPDNINKFFNKDQFNQEPGRAEEPTIKPVQTVESYRAQEQAELSQRIPNIENYKVNGKVDKSLITDENDLETYNEIYDKYDALITPLLEASEETKEQTEVEKAVEELRKEVESIAPVNVPAAKADAFCVVVKSS
jgi:hypothetical protein